MCSSDLRQLFVGQNSERIDIAFRGAGLTGVQLWSHVKWTSRRLTGLGFIDCRTEIGQVTMAQGNKNVARFDVLMNDFASMNVLESY